ncbi:hypothetical protein OSB04_013433 [Centaurea solstitialis]|uniref:F-box domain-containing protein n=1 Tax=Centaurea solstitialis TaxID=347529 RepID=A0AA38TF15_9ASTR|nr:hypothetical protein OSB04_013433 [Centaurea solstitialis]
MVTVWIFLNFMTGNHKTSLLTCAENDIISNLPEHLIGSILERLPIDDAVRTSILSKSWRYRWTTMTMLLFDEQFSKKFAEKGAFGRNGFIRTINDVLIPHNGPISKFSLHIPRIDLDSFQEVDHTMLLISRKSVQELVLTNSNSCYELPSYVSSCSKLRKLELENCIFKPLHKLEVFSNLNHVCLTNIDFGADFCGTLVTLPQLRVLWLDMCRSVYNFNIKASKLKRLAVIDCPDAMLLRLLDAPCLNMFCLCFLEPFEDFVRVERMNLSRLLSNLPEVKNLFLDGHFLKYLSADGIPKWLPRAVYSLSNLRLYDFQLSDLDQLNGALCLLRNSPNLERLCIRQSLRVSKSVPQVPSFWLMWHMTGVDLAKGLRWNVPPFHSSVVEPQVMDYDVGPASNHLESPNCLDQTLNRLQTVEIVYFEGSRPELLFIKLILAHSPSLVKLTIESETFDAHQRLNIAMDVKGFPRASPKAELFFLNPKP